MGWHESQKIMREITDKLIDKMKRWDQEFTIKRKKLMMGQALNQYHRIYRERIWLLLILNA